MKRIERVLFCMLNPSTADAETEDSTLVRCISWTEKWTGVPAHAVKRSAEISACGTYRYSLTRSWSSLFGAAHLQVVNLYAFRSPNPSDLATAKDPFGPANDQAILAAARSADMIVAAWGAFDGIVDIDARIGHVLRLLTIHNDVHALRVTATGRPAHPLYLPGDLEPEIYRRRSS